MAPKKQTICLNMIVKNEAHVIKECLQSVLHLIDCYVINDTGSTDGTQQIIKDFFDAKGIPGEVIDHEFRSCACHGAEYKRYNFFHFAWNRTYALNKCKGKADYLFIMDADDVVEGTLKFPPKLVADQYLLTMRTDNNIYFKALLIRNDPKLKWRYESGLHEYLEGRVKLSYRLVGDYAVNSRRIGARNLNPLKYQQDVAVLEELLAEKPGDVRYTYYLAQSYFDAHDWDKCIAAYQGIIDETSNVCPGQAAQLNDRKFSCRHMKARALVHKGAPPDEIAQAFKDCHTHHPKRAEPLYNLCMHYNAQRQFQEAFDWGTKGLGLPQPTDTVFYVDKTVYDYRLLDELVVSAVNIGKLRLALKWAQKMFSERKYPDSCHQHVANNIMNIQDAIESRSLQLPPSKGRSLCIYVGPSPMFDRTKFGSELATAYLARELAKEYDVFVAGDLCEADKVIDGVLYVHSSRIADQKFDVMIVSRYVNYFVEFDARAAAKKTFVWLHDVDFHTYHDGGQLPATFVHNIDGAVDGYVCLSPWHQQWISDHHPQLRDKVHVIGNGLPGLPDPGIKKVPGKCLWVSQENRGLTELVTHFTDVVQSSIPQAHLDMYRDIAGYEGIPFVHKKGQATNDQVMAAFAEAEYWFYPTNWNETFCISALEAQAAGCICVATDQAALHTTVADRGTLITEPVYSKEYWKACAAAIERYEKDPELKESTKARGRAWAAEQTWDKIAGRWLALFETVTATDAKSGTNDAFARLRVLGRRFGFEPRCVLDVGANVGDWNAAARRLFPTARVLSFEGNPECAAALEGKGAEHVICLLGPEDREAVPFFTPADVGACSTGASMYKESTTWYDGARVQELPMRMLDAFTGDVERVDLLKLDVQGAELDVLAGAQETLKKTDFVLLEASLMRYNERAPLFAEVVAFMCAQGFEAFDLTENHYLNGCCLQADVLFLSRTSPWTARIAEINAAATPWQVKDLYR